VIFVDSNVPMYLVGAPHPYELGVQRALERLVLGRERLVTGGAVLHEILHRYPAIARLDGIGPATDALVAVAGLARVTWAPIDTRPLLRRRSSPSPTRARRTPSQGIRSRHTRRHRRRGPMDVTSIMNHTWLIVGASLAVTLIITIVMIRQFAPMMKSAKNLMDGMAAANQLRVSGIPGVAQVVGVQGTGTMINMMPVCILTLQVMPQGGQPYAVTVQAPVHPVNMPRVQPGQNVPVKIDPNNMMHVVLDM